MVYFIVLLIFLIGTYKYDVRNQINGRRAFFIIECLVLILLYGLRYRIGADSLNYEYKWDFMPTLSEISEWSDLINLEYQPLFYLLAATIKSWGSDFLYFQVFHALFINTMVFIIIKRYSNHIFTSVLFYYLFYSYILNTEIIRESYAVVIFLYSLKYLKTRNYLKYYACCFFGLGFHASAMIFFLFPFCVRFFEKTWSIKQLLYAVIMIMALSFVFKDFVMQILQLGLFSETNQAKIEGYAFESTQNNLFGYLSWLIMCFFYVYVTRIMKQCGVSNPQNNLAVNIVLFTVLLNPLLSIISSRIGGYFTLLFIISFADLIYLNKRTQYLRFNVIAVFVVFLYLNLGGLFLVDTWNSKKEKVYSRYYPYSSIIDKTIYPERESLLKY